MSPSSIARNLTIIQRNCLIAHVNGPQPFLTNDARPTKRSLIEYGLLRAPCGGQPRVSRPKELVLSELGREVVCIVLGQYAEALIAAGALEFPLSKNQLSSAIQAAVRGKTSCYGSFVDADGVAVSVPATPQTE